MVMVFMVEPGSKESVTGRSRAPRSGPSPGSFGLNVGTDAIASTSPLRGSSATALAAFAWWVATARASAASKRN